MAFDKTRENLVQIVLNEVSLIWDLDENEEINSLGQSCVFDSENSVRTGHVHYLENQSGKVPIFSNKDNSMFAVQNMYDQSTLLFEPYSTLDLLMFATVEIYLASGVFVKDIDPQSLTVTLGSRTFFSIFHQ